LIKLASEGGVSKPPYPRVRNNFVQSGSPPDKQRGELVNDAQAKKVAKGE